MADLIDKLTDNEESEQNIDSQEEVEYTIVPKYKKSFVETEHYSKYLENDKVVRMTKTIVWRWGECIVTINENEKKELLSKTTIELINYQCEFVESSDGCVCDYNLIDEDKFTIEDLKEILDSIGEPSSDTESESPESPESPESLREKLLESIYENCNSTYMEDEGDWDMDDTFYVIEDACVLIPEGECVEKYFQNDGTYVNEGYETVCDNNTPSMPTEDN